MNTTERVTNYLRKADMNKWIGHQDVARCLGYSYRTLNRQLAAEGSTKLGALIKAEKRRRVEAALAEKPNIGAKRLAALCGYREVNSFYRAFSSWTGTSWSRYHGKGKHHGRK